MKPQFRAGEVRRERRSFIPLLGSPDPSHPARVPCRAGSGGSPRDAGMPGGQQQPCETESGRKAKRSDASAPCDVHVKQPVPVDTARGALPPQQQQRARFAQQREVCGGRHPVSIPGHPAAPSPAPAGLPEPARLLLQRSSAHGGRGWAALDIPSLPRTPGSSAEGAGSACGEGGAFTPPGASILGRPHSPPGCIRLAQEYSHRPGGASLLQGAPASPPGVHPCPREVPASRPGAPVQAQQHPPGASPAHPELPRRPGAGCGSILSSHGGNPAPTAPPDGCEEPNAS